MSVVNIDDVMAHLNMTDVDEYELGNTIDAAEAAIAARVGPLEPATLTATVSGNGFSFVLPVTPVISVESAVSTYWGTDTDLTLLSLDSASGRVQISPTGQGLVGGGSVASTYTSPTYTVTYTAGRAELSADLVFAVKEMVRHLWKSQRGAAARPGSPEQTPAAGYLIPNAVAELLEPHMMFGFA